MTIRDNTQLYFSFPVLEREDLNTPKQTSSKDSNFHLAACLSFTLFLLPMYSYSLKCYNWASININMVYRPNYVYIIIHVLVHFFVDLHISHCIKLMVYIIV